MKDEVLKLLTRVRWGLTYVEICDTLKASSKSIEMALVDLQDDKMIERSPHGDKFYLTKVYRSSIKLKIDNDVKDLRDEIATVAQTIFEATASIDEIKRKLDRVSRLFDSD